MEEESVEIKTEVVENECDQEGEGGETDPDSSEDERNLSTTKEKKYERNDEMSSIPIRKSTRIRKKIVQSDDDDGESSSDDQHRQLSNRKSMSTSKAKTKVKQEKLSSPDHSSDSVTNSDDSDSGSGFELRDEEDEESLTDEDERHQSSKRKKSIQSPAVKQRRKIGSMGAKRQRKNACVTCGEAFSSKILLQNHKDKYHSPYYVNGQCTICKLDFKTNHLFFHHYRRMCGGSTKAKKDPNYLFDPTKSTHYYYRKLRLHENIENKEEKERYSVCYICGTMVSSLQLNRHLSHRHGIQPSDDDNTVAKFLCSHCPRKFSHMYQLKAHCRTIHNEKCASKGRNKKLVTTDCSRCPSKFNNYSELKSHVQSSHPNNFFLCQFCDFLCYSKPTIKFHYKKCPIGTRDERKEAFANIDGIDLINFEIPCEICERKITLLGIRKHLQRVHEIYEDVKFKCLHCPAQYFERSFLANHCDVVHGIEVDKMPPGWANVALKNRSDAVIQEFKDKMLHHRSNAARARRNPYKNPKETPEEKWARRRPLSFITRMKYILKNKLVGDNAPNEQIERELAKLTKVLDANYILREQLKTYENGQFKTAEERQTYIVNRRNYANALLKIKLLIRSISGDEMEQQLAELMETYMDPPLGADGLPLHPFEPNESRRERRAKKELTADRMTSTLAQTPESRAIKFNKSRLSQLKTKLKASLMGDGVPPNEIKRQLAELERTYVPVKRTAIVVYKPRALWTPMSRVRLQKKKELMAAGMTSAQAYAALETPEERAKRLNNIRLACKRIKLKAQLAEEGASPEEIERQLAELKKSYVPVKAKSEGYKPKPSRSAHFSDKLKTVVYNAKKSLDLLESQVSAPVLPCEMEKVKVTQPNTCKSLVMPVSNERIVTNEAFNVTQNSFGLPWVPKQADEHRFEERNVTMNPPLDCSQLESLHQFDVDNNDALDTPTHSPKPFSHVEVEKSSPPQCNDLSPQNEELCGSSSNHVSLDPMADFNAMMPPFVTESKFLQDSATQQPSTSHSVSNFLLSPTCTPIMEESNDKNLKKEHKHVKKEICPNSVRIKREKRERKNLLKRSHKSRHKKRKLGVLRNIEKHKRLVICVKRLTEAEIQAYRRSNNDTFTSSRKIPSFESHTHFEPDTDYAAGTNRICHICGVEVAAQYLTYHIIKHCADDDIKLIKIRLEQPPKSTPKSCTVSRPNCSRCPAKFASLIKLKTHVEAAHPDNYFPCPFCSTFRYTKEGMITHLKMFCHRKDKSTEKKAVIKKLGDGPHLANYVVPCELCEKPICLVTFRSHLGSVHRVVEDPLKCFYCDSLFTTRTKLADHADFVHGVTIDKLPADWIKVNLKLRDEVKKKRYDVKLDLTQHGWSNWSTSSGMDPSVKTACHICGVFVEKRHMPNHLYTKHNRCVENDGDIKINMGQPCRPEVLNEVKMSSLGKTKCSRCSDELRFSDLKSHVGTFHLDQYFPCPFCSAFRYNKESILAHLRYTCQASVAKAEKQAAIDKLGDGPNLGNYTIPCELCERPYSVRTFKLHLSSAHNVTEEPIKCLCCQKQFRMRFSFVDHMDFEHGIEIDKLPVEWIKLRLKDETIQRRDVFSNGVQYGWNLSTFTTLTLKSEGVLDPAKSVITQVNMSNSGGNARSMEICYICGLSVGRGLQKHIDTEHGDVAAKPKPTEFLCSLCPSSYKTAQGLKYHGEKVHRAVYPTLYGRLTVSECSRCPSKFENPSQLKYHVKTTHPNNYFPCPFCNLFRYNKATLRHHLGKCRHSTMAEKIAIFKQFGENENIDNYKVPCEICENRISLTRFNVHLKKTHGVVEDKKMICLCCPREYTSRDAFADHMDWVHGVEVDTLPEGWYKLNLIDRSDQVIQGLKAKFKSEALEESNQSPRKGRKPLRLALSTASVISGTVDETGRSECGYCGAFVHERFLNRHIYMMHGARADHSNWLSCPQCACRFKSESGLNIHIRKVHDSENKNIRRFKISCELCGFSVYLTSFETHLKKVHEVTEDKKLICFHCPQEFNKRVDFVEHVDSEHGGDMFKFPEGWSNVSLKNRSDEVIQQLKDKYVEVIAAEEREGVKSRHFVKGLTKPICSEKKLNVSKKEHFPLKEELNAECSQDGSDEETGSSEGESSEGKC